MKIIFKSIITSSLLLAFQASYAARMHCLCCDEMGELIEFKVVSCEAKPVNTQVWGMRYQGKYDLLIDGIISSSIPYNRNKPLDIETQQKDMSIERIFVYEGRNEKTCEDFPPGKTKVMHYTKLACVLLDEKDFSGDLACLNGGHKISGLPFYIQIALDKFK